MRLPPLTDGDAPLAGYIVGKLAGNRVPIITGATMSEDEHKAFGAAVAATGAVSMYIPAARIGKERGRADRSRVEEVLSVSRADLGSAKDDLRGDDDWDLVAMGCPHCSARELRSMARYLDRRRPSRDCDVWFCTSRKVYSECARDVAVLKRFGKVLCDTCMVVSPIERMYKSTATNSGKAMVYLPTLGKQKASFRTTEQLMEAISC